MANIKKYMVCFYTDNKAQYEGSEPHSDISDSVDDIIKAESAEEALEIAKDYLKEGILDDYYPVIDETGHMIDRVPYTVENNPGELLAYAEGYDESLSCYYNFEVYEIDEYGNKVRCNLDA